MVLLVLEYKPETWVWSSLNLVLHPDPKGVHTRTHPKTRRGRVVSQPFGSIQAERTPYRPHGDEVVPHRRRLVSRSSRPTGTTSHRFVLGSPEGSDPGDCPSTASMERTEPRGCLT